MNTIAHSKAYRLFLFALAIVMLLMLIPNGAYASNVVPASSHNSAIEGAQHGVVRVFNSGGTGSGFFVGALDGEAKIIVTNHHVIEGADKNFITVTDIDGRLSVNILYKNADLDLAILELDSPLSGYKNLPLLSPKELHKTQKIYAIGFPGVGDIGNSTLSSGIDHLTVTDGSVSNPQHVIERINYVWADITVNGGNSGGPMLDEYGRVVGVNSLVVQDRDFGNAMTLALSADYIVDAFNQLGLPYVLETGEPGADSGTDDKDSGTDEDKDTDDDRPSVWLYVGVGVAVASLAVLVYFFILSKSKSKTPSCRVCGKPVPAGTDICSACRLKSSGGSGGYSGGANVNQGGANVNVGGGNINRVAETQPVKRLVVVCEQGGAKGAVAKSSSKVRVGRDPQTCSLVFPANSPGVSREHCEIRLLSNGIQVTDLNSTYGVYLSNGKRVQGSCLVKSGEYILLGSKSNIISVNIK